LLGTQYRLKGELQSSEQQRSDWYQKSLAALMRAKAIVEHMKLSKDPNYAYLYLHLGQTYLRLSQPRLALESLEYGYPVRPDSTFFIEIANAYEALKEPDQAAVRLTAAMMLDPTEKTILPKLMNVFKQIDSQGCAFQDAPGQPPRLNMACPVVKDKICRGALEIVALDNKLGRTVDASQAETRAITAWGCPAQLFQSMKQ
jgi:tetratricopeptide (TPR) repeat protein